MHTATCFRAAAFPFFAVLAAACAHPQTVTLTSANAPAPPMPVAPAAEPAAEPVAEEAAPAAEAAPVAKPAKAQQGPLTFEQLSAQLGDDSKLALDDSVGNGSSVAPASKGLSADGYQNVGATHQAVPETTRSGGDVKVTGGISVSSVRETVRGSNDRLRVCYEHGFGGQPHAPGRVTVTVSVDATGSVSAVDAESDTLPSEVTSCVRIVFSSMTFSAPKTAPAKIVYPIAFNKDS